jgi:signal transduction histidine kinase
VASLARLLERRLSVRARSTLVATVVVAVALLAGSLLLLGIYRSQLAGRLDATLERQAAERAQLLGDGLAPEAVVPVLVDESMVWIGQPDGSTLATDGPVQPLVAPLPDRIGQTSQLSLLVSERSAEEAREHGPGGDEEDEEDEGPDAEDDDSEDDGDESDQRDEEATDGAEGDEDDEDGGDDGEDNDEDDDGSGVETMELRVASAATDDGSVVVVVGARAEGITGAVGSLARLFLIGLPPLVGLVGLLTWSTAGRALSPVERIRGRADEISGANLGERVPVPDTRDEIHHLARTVNAMLDRIEAHDRSLRQFTADASHELKSPVANLRALVDTASLDDPRWPALRTALAGESDRLRDLVENLLYLAAHDAGRPRPAVTGVALDELVFREAEVVAVTGRVVVDIGGVAPAEVAGVEADLARLVRNLVDNAVRHAEGRLALAVEVGADDVVLVVGDDGPGIPEADRERVFDRFTRLDPARARTDGGAGLGLAIVDRIAGDHGASVTVGRSPLGGAEFRVRFPRSRR